MDVGLKTLDLRKIKHRIVTASTAEIEKKNG
jgi:hypothetical protein